MKRELEFLICCITGGYCYFLLEILCRGYSHYSMFLCGGFCFFIVGKVGSRIYRSDISLISRLLVIMCFGSFVITCFEYFTGCIFNIKMGLDIWDYSGMFMNYRGQICLVYSALWGMASLACVAIYGLLEEKIFCNTKKYLSK